MSRTISLVVAVFCAYMTGAHAQDATAPTAPATEQSAAAKEAPPAGAVAAPKSESVDARLPEWWDKSEWWVVIALGAIALIGLGLTTNTSRLWKTSSALLKETSDSSRKELRAYVALDEIFFTEAGDVAAGVHKLRIRNYGQTPAYRMAIWCERASHLPQAGVSPYYDTPVVDGQLLHPVQAYTVGLAAAPLYRIGKPGFFTYGRIVYHDIYQQWWVTKFCFRYEGEGSFVPSGDYNTEEGPFEKRPA